MDWILINISLSNVLQNLLFSERYELNSEDAFWWYRHEWVNPVTWSHVSFLYDLSYLSLFYTGEKMYIVFNILKGTTVIRKVPRSYFL